VTHFNNIYKDTHTRAFGYDVRKKSIRAEDAMAIYQWILQSNCVISAFFWALYCLGLTNFDDVGQCRSILPN